MSLFSLLSREWRWRGRIVPLAAPSGRGLTGGGTLAADRTLAAEIYALGSVQAARTLRSGSTDLFHVVGYDSSTSGDALALKAAA